MKKRFREEYEGDPRESGALMAEFRRLLEEDDDEAYGEEAALLTYRGGGGVFDLAVGYCLSGDVLDRVAGAYVLGQIGWSDREFLDESVEVLISMLGDADVDVLHSVAVALGHRKDARAIGPLEALAGHANDLVRSGVVYGLLGHEDERAVEALKVLARDEVVEVRDWAMFGIGSMIEWDTPTIRKVLMAGLDDVDDDVRGEALKGLAARGDLRVVEALLREWDREWIGRLSFEAAEEIADLRLVERLEELLESMDFEDDADYRDAVERALAACLKAGDLSRAN